MSFDESILIINDEIYKKKHKWTLTAIQWMDFQDVAQILRIHINNKWDMWDQTRPLRPWLHALITNQIRNILRNIYTSTSRPCLSCAAAEGENLCSLFTTQCSACPIYAHWFKTKKNAHDVKLPLALEFHYNEVHGKSARSGDIEKGVDLVHEKMKMVLKPIEFKVYKYLYIDGKDEDEIGKYLGFKTSEKTRAAGYRQIKNIKDAIFEKAKKMIYGDEIDF